MSIDSAKMFSILCISYLLIKVIKFHEICQSNYVLNMVLFVALAFAINLLHFPTHMKRLLLSLHSRADFILHIERFHAQWKHKRKSHVLTRSDRPIGTHAFALSYVSYTEFANTAHHSTWHLMCAVRTD